MAQQSDSYNNKQSHSNSAAIIARSIARSLDRDRSLAIACAIAVCVSAVKRPRCRSGWPQEQLEQARRDLEVQDVPGQRSARQFNVHATLSL